MKAPNRYLPNVKCNFNNQNSAFQPNFLLMSDPSNEPKMAAITTLPV